MWSPAVSAQSAAFREAFQMLYDRLELGASRGQLRVSVETAARMVMSATTGAALSLASTAIVAQAGRRGAGSGAALGGLRVGQQMGFAFGPAVAGFAFAHGGRPPAFLLLALFLLAAAAIALPSTSSLRPAPRPAPI